MTSVRGQNTRPRIHSVRGRRADRAQLHPREAPGGQVIAASEGNHAGRPKAIDDDMLTFAQALEEEIPLLCLTSTVSPPVSGVLGEALE